MAKYTYKRITYQELKDGTYKNAYIPQDDKFPVTSHVTSSFRDAMLACPNNNDGSKTFMHLFVDEEGKEIGRNIRFGTRIKAGESVYSAESGCGFEVIEEYRKEGLGADLLMLSLQNSGSDLLLGAGLTHMAYPLHRKMKYHLFQVPQYYIIKRVMCVFKNFGPKILLYLGWFIVNMFKKIPSHIKYNRLKKTFIVKKEKIIPKWVSDMVANDGHQYMEVHDREWFQWNLDYNTYGLDEDIQSFYSIFDSNNKPMGFFMTKERLVHMPGPDYGMIRGTVVEWESCDKSILSEADINLLALQTFSKNVVLINTLACESETANQLKRMGFREKAAFNFSIKDKKKRFENIGDQNQWRLRYGYTHTIIL